MNWSILTAAYILRGHGGGIRRSESSETIGIRYAVNRKDAKSVIIRCDGFYEPDRGIARQRIGGNYVKIFNKEA